LRDAGGDVRRLELPGDILSRLSALPDEEYASLIAEPRDHLRTWWATADANALAAVVDALDVATSVHSAGPPTGLMQVAAPFGRAGSTRPWLLAPAPTTGAAPTASTVRERIVEAVVHRASDPRAR
jgi:hypothetical protein